MDLPLLNLTGMSRLLDEATSHLDRENETMVQQTLSQLGITRIIIAHRKETIEAADRVILMQGGMAREINPSEGPR